MAEEAIRPHPIKANTTPKMSAAAAAATVVPDSQPIALVCPRLDSPSIREEIF